MTREWRPVRIEGHGFISDGDEIVALLAQKLETIWREPDAGARESHGDPRQHEVRGAASGLGNIPQALSHVALVHTALTLAAGGESPRLDS